MLECYSVLHNSVSKWAEAWTEDTFSCTPFFYPFLKFCVLIWCWIRHSFCFSICGEKINQMWFFKTFSEQLWKPLSACRCLLCCWDLKIIPNCLLKTCDIADYLSCRRTIDIFSEKSKYETIKNDGLIKIPKRVSLLCRLSFSSQDLSAAELSQTHTSASQSCGSC